MATTTTIPVSEYLSTTYRPDCDYIDGEIQERHLGEYDHGRIQLSLEAFLLGKSAEWRIRVATEIRVQVSESRFRVVDICIMDENAPQEQIIRHPPILCIEVLSPDDTLMNMIERLHDYRDMGVRQVWLIDAPARSVTIYQGTAWVEHHSGYLSVPGTLGVVSIPSIFSVLDQTLNEFPIIGSIAT